MAWDAGVRRVRLDGWPFPPLARDSAQRASGFSAQMHSDVFHFVLLFSEANFEELH